MRDYRARKSGSAANEDLPDNAPPLPGGTTAIVDGKYERHLPETEGPKLKSSPAKKIIPTVSKTTFSADLGVTAEKVFETDREEVFEANREKTFKRTELKVYPSGYQVLPGDDWVRNLTQAQRDLILDRMVPGKRRGWSKE